MTRLAFAKEARADIRDITTYLRDNAGLRVAERYFSNITRLCRNLTEHPYRGPARLKFGPHIRIAVVKPYLIVYRYDATRDTVFILRVVHSRRDLGPGIVPTEDEDQG
jgi:toxin ParE1/3/4